MPTLSVYVDDTTMKRLRVSSEMLGRTVEELAESGVAEAAIHAVPCMNGKPYNAEQRAVWDRLS